MLDLASHTDTTVLVVEGMLDVVNEDVPRLFLEAYCAARIAVRDERQRRGHPATTIYDPVIQAPAGRFDYAGLSDLEVRFWYALGAEIADYSCLGRNVRDHVNAIWLQSEAELKRRGLKREFFCDIQGD